jgi:hypothetical protein
MSSHNIMKQLGEAINGSNAILPATDDTGLLAIGDGSRDVDFKWFGGTTSDYANFDVGLKELQLAGDMRLNLSSCTSAAANTDGSVIKAGTSSARVVEDTASNKFISLYWDCGATSGDAQGLYNRLYITGAGGGGDALRSFCTVEDVAGATARGAHISLSFGSSGTLSGLGSALTTTLHIPNSATQTGTLCSINAEIWSDGATSDPAGATLSAIRVVNGGNATGAADVDDDCALLDFSGWTAGSGNMISAVGNEPTWTSKTHQIRCRLPDGSPIFLIGVIP